MPEPILHKFFDFGDRALANLTLASGERVLLTILPGGFAVHRLHLFGMIPGRCVFGAVPSAYGRMVEVLVRDIRQLPPLPRAKGQHQDDPSIHARSDAERQTLRGSPRPLALFTRLALTARDEDDLVRLFERARNVSG